MALPSRFTKMAGGGNDFLVFEADGRALSEEDRRRLSRLCRRGLSVGADGALFLSPAGDGRVRVDYFNADGGLASFCANGTRCSARYAARHGLTGADPVLETGWGAIPARVSDGLVTLALPDPPPPGRPVRSWGEGLPAEATPIEVGVPHLVAFVGENLAALPIAELAPPLRRHPDLPGGANVHFVAVTGPNRLSIRSFERGVEAETLACGSGVVAAAIVAARDGRVSAPVVCDTKSGVAFRVGFERSGDGARRVTLEGDAREIFTADLTEEAWQE